MAWIDIDGYEGLYRISSAREVVGLKRGKLIKPLELESGAYVSLSKEGGTRRFSLEALYRKHFPERKAEKPAQAPKAKGRPRRDYSTVFFCKKAKAWRYRIASKEGLSVSRRSFDSYELAYEAYKSEIDFNKLKGLTP